MQVVAQHSVPFEDCSAIILAGGESRRMKQEKASILWNGATFLSHAVRCMRKVAGEVLAVAREEQSTEEWEVNRVILDDAELPPGPLRGIVAGLSECRTPYAIVVPCDAPCLEPTLFRGLRARVRENVVAVIPEWEGRLQILLSLWRVSACRDIQKLLACGVQAPSQIPRYLPCDIVPESTCRTWSPQGRSFLNINSRSELHVLESQRLGS